MTSLMDYPFAALFKSIELNLYYFAAEKWLNAQL